jgi:S1-C subfamily serine protease
LNRPALSLLLTAVAPLFLAGCVQGTISERKSSLSSYAQARVGGVTLHDYLLSRTAVLITGDHLRLTASETNPGAIDFQASSRKLGRGCAAAVDHRGYFVTAAHAVGKEPTYLVFLGHRGQLQVEAAHVVWRADVSKGEPDLALLQVPRRLGQVFDWVSDFQVGKPVVAVGQDYQPPLHIKMVCFAGALEASEAESGTRLGARSVRHSAPLRNGDSGGPLADLQGRLIGINVKTRRTFSPLHPLGTRVGVAEHPDLTWLKRLIDENAAEARLTNQSPNKDGGADGELGF